MATKFIVLFDLDGTLADNQHRQHLVQGDSPQWDQFFLACGNDRVISPVATMFALCERAGYRNIIVSGRGEIARSDTESWIRRMLLDSSSKFNMDRDLFMRPKGDYRPDHVLKKEWLTSGAIPKDYVLCVYDDRDSVVKMWREEGLQCFQVAPGDF